MSMSYNASIWYPSVVAGAKAVLCPVCGGRGNIRDEHDMQTAGLLEKTCHGCGGRGWVEVGR
jgi:DnaJ-class molecular chaperone